jgi:hypothetical protein
VLMNCHCRSIAPHEGQLHMKAISDSFSSPEEVCAVMTAPITHKVPSLYFVAVWATFMELMGVEPEKFDDLGDPLYSAEAVRGCLLRMNVGEAAPIMAELETECLYTGWDESTGRD